jgi:hypothetical protein
LIANTASGVSDQIKNFVQHSSNATSEQFPSGNPPQTISTDYDPRRAAIEHSLGAALGLVGPGMAKTLAFPAEASSAGLGIFAGRNARTANLEKLAAAEQMHAAGIPGEQIRQQTGWMRGADDQWRYEISDRGAKFGPPPQPKPGPQLPFEPPLPPNTQPKAPPINVREPGAHYLGDIYQHPKLYEAYPELANTRVRLEDMKNKANIGYLDPDGSMGFNTKNSAATIQSSIPHELQHVIQGRERFASGGSPGEFVGRAQESESKIRAINEQMSSLARDMSNLNLDGAVRQVASQKYHRLLAERSDLAEASNPYNLYRNLAGETEARNVQARLKFTDKERTTLPPVNTEDVPRARQEVRFGKPGEQAETRPEKLTGFAPSAPAIRGTTDVSAAAPYVTDPIRVANPGVYKRPDVIAREAAANVAPEHPALKSLFGVTRDDLYEISKHGTRPGNIEPKIWMPSKETKGSYAADAVMNPANAQRLVDTLSEAQKYPELIKGMDPWYVMDPMYRQMVKLVGPEEAKLAYTKLNASVGPFSAGSNVSTEINRGTAAHMAAVQGNYPEFRQFAGVAEKKRGADFPDWLRDVKGHAYHGVQADPVTRWLATGEHGYANDTVKIPLYLQASGVPQTGFQTRLPVPDAHFTRAVGMPDVRRNQSFNDYMGGSEYRPVGPWFRENVAKPLGIEAVPAQARMWGTFAPQTGVDTAIGAGKLELMAQNIWERAKKLGIDPKVLRDQVLRGENHATWLGPAAAGGALAPAMFDREQAPPNMWGR